MKESSTTTRAMMQAQLECEHKNFSVVLTELARSMPSNGWTLRQLLEQLADRGLLMLCMVLTVPFLLPVSIPGSSTPFGLLIAIVGFSIMMDHQPYLPSKIVDKQISAHQLRPVLEKGSQLFAKIERWIHCRVPVMTESAFITRFNGFMIITNAGLLMIPLPLPLSNTIPAYGVLFVAAGMLQRDGYLVILGYAMALLSILYFSLVAFAGMLGLQFLLS